MDSESKHSIRVLESIAWCNEELIALALWANSEPFVRSIHNRFDCRAYKSGTMLEAYVEAELIDEKTVCWWLDVRWNEHNWHIETTVLINDTDTQGQRVLKEFPQRTPATLDDFIVQLKEATSDLVAYARSLDLGPAFAE